MRCVGCEMEPVTSAHYCESCGSRLSPAETSTLESPVVGPDHWAPDGDPASDTRCDSCGGPNANGDLCGACQRAFFSSWLDGAVPVAAPATTACADAEPIQETPSSEPVSSDALARDSSDAAALAEMPIPAPVLVEETMTSVDDTMSAAGAEAVSAEEVQAKAARREEPKAQAARLTGSRTDATHAGSALKPVAVQKRPSLPVPPQDRHPSIALAAAGLVVAAIGISAYWLQFHEQPAIAREEPPRLVSKTVTTVTKRRPSTSVLSVAAVTESALAPPEVPASARPTPATPAPARASAKAVRPPSPVTRQVPLVSIPIPAIEVPASAIAPLAPDAIATAPPPVPPSLPLGRFFETMDVNELPRVALRVEPQLPDELLTRPLNEVVIVRVLVSQGGHPSRISVLRRSKAGPRLDNAVIAAVNQWTFSPARKRGEAVSCWFNFGVPVGGVD